MCASLFKDNNTVTHVHAVLAYILMVSVARTHNVILFAVLFIQPSSWTIFPLGWVNDLTPLLLFRLYFPDDMRVYVGIGEYHDFSNLSDIFLLPSRIRKWVYYSRPRATCIVLPAQLPQLSNNGSSTPYWYKIHTAKKSLNIPVITSGSATAGYGRVCQWVCTGLMALARFSYVAE